MGTELGRNARSRLTTTDIPLHEIMRLMRLNAPKMVQCFVEIRDDKIVSVLPIHLGGPFKEGLNGT